MGCLVCAPSRFTWHTARALLHAHASTYAQDAGSLEIRKIEKDRSEIAATIPAWCCTADGRLCLSSAVALFDEISTFGGLVSTSARRSALCETSGCGQEKKAARRLRGTSGCGQE